MLSKSQIRKLLRKKRQLLSAQVSYRAGISIDEHLKKYPPYFRAKNIACYLASDGEISLAAVIETLWQRNKKVYLPTLSKLDRRPMYFSSFYPHTVMTGNKYGIFEPASHLGEGVNRSALDIVLLPLVAFNQQGDRLGMGGGYYDRYFSFLLRSSSGRKPKLVGVAYDFQETGALSSDKWDVPLDAIITESRIINIRKST